MREPTRGGDAGEEQEPGRKQPSANAAPGPGRKNAQMVDDDKYCIDILTQVSAATKALQSVALGLLEEHLGTCVVDAAREGGAHADAKVKEASEAIARLVRS